MGVRPICLVNALAPFRTRLADDGLVHVRAWRTDDGPVAVVAELDWALLTAKRDDAYYGPGIFTYPHYALPAASAAPPRALRTAPRTCGFPTRRVSGLPG